MRGALRRWSGGWIASIAIGGTVLLAAQQPAPQQPAEQAPATQQPANQQPADQQQAERTQQPPIRTGINFVRVDVIVSDGKGQPVTDLEAEDFSISEDGKPQKVESFTLVKIDNTAQVEDRPVTSIRNDYDEEREAARPDVRLFVILLDDYHVRLGNSMAVRKPLTEFIQNSLGPADMVALMYPLTPVADIRFSRDRDALIGAIEKFEGRKFDYRPRNPIEERYAYYPAAVVERLRNQLTMGALKAAAFRMGGLREGRKSIIFVSEGFTGTLPPQLNDPVASMPGFRNPARGRATPDSSAEMDRAEFFNTVDLNSEMRDVFEVANRQNTSIYPVDPRGLGAFEYDINETVGQQTDRRALNSSLDTLRVLADNTDGRAILNRNDLAVGMRQIIRDSSAYYLIGYTSTQAPTDGKFHKIEVKVARRGVDVRARKGYWAYTAEDAARALAPPAPEPPSAVTTALNAIAEPARGRPARFWIGTNKGENGKTRVTFAWERIATVPGDRRETEPAARVVLNAMTPDGRPIFRGRVPDQPSAAEALVSSNGTSSPPPATSTSSAAAGAPAGSVATFEAPPGQLQMRITVEGMRGQVIDSVTRELTVPDFTKVEVTMGTPRVFRGRTVRDLANIRANPAAVPTADRDFSRAERLLVRVDAYTPGGVTPKVTARLLNRNGQKMSDLPIQTPAGGSAELEFALSALPAGDYLIELNAAAESGTAQEMIAFRIGR
jgi:VWFA-related protein